MVGSIIAERLRSLMDRISDSGSEGRGSIPRGDTIIWGSALGRRAKALLLRAAGIKMPAINTLATRRFRLLSHKALPLAFR